VELEKKYITKLEFEKYFAGPHTKAPFTLWCGNVTMEILRALKEHPKAVPWKFCNYLHVDIDCTENDYKISLKICRPTKNSLQKKN
jgi:hypothetical protein